MYGQGGPGDRFGGGSGFFQSLFDFSFSHFVTPKLVRLAYIFAVLGVGLLGVVGLFVALADGGLTAVIALVFIPLLFLAWTAFVRIILEIFIVVFRIAEPIRDAAVSLDELKKLTRRLGRSAMQSAAVATAEGSSVGEEVASGKHDSGQLMTDDVEAERSSGEHASEHGGAVWGHHIASEGHRFCVQCGEENSTENRFCFSCGAALDT